MLGAGHQDGTANTVWHFMIEFIPKLVADSVMQLTEVGLTQREAENELRLASGQLARTLASHFRQAPVRQGHANAEAPQASIEGVLDIEESIWAPRFGLKGVIDATIVSHVRGKANGRGHNRDGDPVRFGLAALEFKSGKVYHSHAAQLGLYSLLLQSRYGTDPVSGLLWYSRVENMDTVSLRSNDVAGATACRCRGRPGMASVAHCLQTHNAYILQYVYNYLSQLHVSDAFNSVGHVTSAPVSCATQQVSVQAHQLHISVSIALWRLLRLWKSEL